MELQRGQNQQSAITAPQISVAGEVFRSLEELDAALRRWHTELDQDTYNIRLNEAVWNVSQSIEKVETAGERILFALYEIGRATMPNFDLFKRTGEYRNVRAKVDNAMKNVAKNQQAVAKARQEVINKWGNNGRIFLSLNNAQNWTKSVGRLAKAVPDYTTAMSLLVCALVARFRAMKSGKTKSLTPGGTDIQKAIDLSKLSPRPQPVSRGDLTMYGVKYNEQGLLDPIDPKDGAAAITSGETDNAGSFKWDTGSEMPEISQDIIEEVLGDEDADGITFNESAAHVHDPRPAMARHTPMSTSARLLTRSAALAPQPPSSASLPPTQVPSTAAGSTDGNINAAEVVSSRDAGPPPKKKARIPKPASRPQAAPDNDSGSGIQNQFGTTPSNLKLPSAATDNAGGRGNAGVKLQFQPQPPVPRSSRAGRSFGAGRSFAAPTSFQPQAFPSQTRKISTRLQPQAAPNNDSASRIQNQSGTIPLKLNLLSTATDKSEDRGNPGVTTQLQSPVPGRSRPQATPSAAALNTGAITSSNGSDIRSGTQNHGTGIDSSGPASVKPRGAGPERTQLPQGQSESDCKRATGILVDLLERLNVPNPVDEVAKIWEQQEFTVSAMFKWFVDCPVVGRAPIDLAQEEIDYLLQYTNITNVNDIQYGIIQQLAEMDPVWWLINALVKNETKLYAVPQPAAAPGENTPYGESATISKEVGKSYVLFHPPANSGACIIFRPTLLSLREIQSITPGVASVAEVLGYLSVIRRERTPVPKDLATGAMSQVVVCPNTVHLSGISPLSDAITAQRSYLDREVQAEIDILLGTDRDFAWEYIQHWRRVAFHTIRLRFAIWRKAEGWSSLNNSI